MAWLLCMPAVQAGEARTVHFLSADGRTGLVAYQFTPETAGPHPAVVLLHGRAGPYSSTVSAACTQVAPGVASRCGADTLSQRHKMWADYWVSHGYVALLVDSFGPRGRAHGFPRGSHGDPAREAVNELDVRPLDAEGAAAWLAAQAGVRRDRIFLQGWSHGGSTTLNTLHRQGRSVGGTARFAAALAFYPGCGQKALLARELSVDVPWMLLLAGDDEEVSPTLCRELAERSRGAAVAPLWQWYAGATHGFDDPGKARQSLAANRDAQADALRRAAAFFDAVR